jgi:folate-binding protein YgfZ
VVDERRLGVASIVIYVPDELEGPLLAGIGRDAAIESTLDALDVVRIEAGVPKFLADMDEHTIPLEAGIEDTAISFTKGCYVGQEVIVRVTTRGQGRVAKKLVGLVLGSGARHEPGLLPEFVGAKITSGDREVGRVTSAAHSPMLGRDIALGYVHRDFVEPGTAVHIGDHPAVVAAVPFVPS